MYLYPGFIYCCRCSFNNWCICAGLIFAVADTLLAADVSARPWYSFLQILFFRPMYLQLALFMTCRCFSSCLTCKLHLHLAFSKTWGYFLRKFFICIPHFPYLADASHWNYISSTYSFYALRMLSSKITHLQSPKIHYRRYHHLIFLEFYLNNYWSLNLNEVLFIILKYEHAHVQSVYLPSPYCWMELRGSQL